MILQGTDAFSRGVDIQALSSYESNSFVPMLWRAAPPIQYILQWCLSVVPIQSIPSTSRIIQTDFSDWSRTPILCRSVLWCVSPSVARQAILQALYVWVEAPSSSGHIFLVSRILQRDYGRLSKFVLVGGQFDNLPLPFIPLVPFVVYYIPPFDHRAIYEKQRHQLINHVDTSPIHMPAWIRQEIDSMLRVSAPYGHGR